MRKSSSQTVKLPSPTATPFVPTFTSGPATASSSSVPPTKYTAPARVNLPPSRIPCKFYQKGYCSRGNDCWYMHDASSVPVPMIVEEDGRKRVVERDPKGKGRASAASTKDSEEAGTAEEGEPCAICFETPITYGLLTNCNHVFCLECIRSWRSSGNKHKDSNTLSFAAAHLDDGALNKTSKTCPLCRVRSKFIIPSSIFPTPPPGSQPSPPDSDESDLSSNPAKAAIVQRYLDKLGTIPCRYFKDSMTTPVSGYRGMRNGKGHEIIIPYCPFGNECHYHHPGRRPGESYIFTDRELSNHRRSRSLRGNQNSRERSRLMQRMLFGVLNDPDYNPRFHANAAEAQAMLEILIESHAPDWAFDLEDEAEEEEEEFGGYEDGWGYEGEDDEIEDDDDEEYLNMVDMMDVMEMVGQGPPHEDYGLGRRETRAEDGSLHVQVDFRLGGGGEYRGGDYRRRRGAPIAEEDEMPRLIEVDDLD